MSQLQFSDERVVIAGAGIAGLTTALALAHCGLASLVLEQRSEFSAAGAGIQLGPNATRILGELGVLAELADAAVAPDAIAVADARSGRQIVRLPLGPWIEQRCDAPYLVAHRADLQRALVSKAGANPLIEVRLGCAVAGPSSPPNRPAGDQTLIELSDGRHLRAPLVVGADGMWSILARALRPSLDTAYSGMIAARTLVDFTILPARFDARLTYVWLAPDAHVVMYPVSAGAKAALVVIRRGPRPESGWSGEIEADRLLKHLDPFNDDLWQILRAGETWRQWPLFDPQPLDSWSWHNVQLIGDAAHPMLPFNAQGGAMAIEDGFVLGQLIAQHGPRPDIVFPVFRSLRWRRVAQVQRAARQNGRIYHLQGLAARGRDLAMRVLPPDRLMQRYDWIYQWRYDRG